MANLIETIVVTVVVVVVLVGAIGAMPKTSPVQNIAQGFTNLTTVLGGK